jgi:hypothetical protein
MSDEPKPPRDEDVVLVLGGSEDGKSVGVLRKRRERIEVGAMRNLEEGRPITGEVVKLTPRPGSPLLDVEVLHDDNEAQPSRPGQGPARVASARYRAGWQAIWGRRRRDTN